MGIAVQPDGSVVLTANYSDRTQTIPAGTSPDQVDQIAADFFSSDAPPPVTRADVLTALANATGIAVGDLTSFFNGAMK